MEDRYMKSIQLLVSEVKLLQINLRCQYIYNRLQQNQMDLPSTSSILLQNDSNAQLRASVSSFDLEVQIENTQLQYTSAIDEEIDTVAFSLDQQNMISPPLYGHQPQLLSNDSSTSDRFSIYFDVYRCPNQAFLSNILDQLPKISRIKGDLNLDLKINRKKFKCTICHQAVQKKSQIFNLKCKHKYHKKCLEGWHKHKNNCPLCRKQLISEQSKRYL